jgi:nucleoside-diphosphate-sugar epimerase
MALPWRLGDGGSTAESAGGSGRRRLATETALNVGARQSRVPIVILRVPGIYGPGYLPRRLRSGEPVLREDESPFSNRIHADDLAHLHRRRA